MILKRFLGLAVADSRAHLKKLALYNTFNGR